MTLAPQPLFRHAMGRLYHLLPGPVRRQHGAIDILLSSGRCNIDRGGGASARLIGWLFGFPPAGRDLPTRVTVIAAAGQEIWHRDFAGKGIFTVLEPARRCGRPAIVERFGLVSFDLALDEAEDGLRLTVAGMRAAGIAVPRRFWPVLKATERAEAQRFLFDIEVRLGWGARLIHYRGWLAGVPG